MTLRELALRLLDRLPWRYRSRSALYDRFVAEQYEERMTRWIDAHFEGAAYGVTAHFQTILARAPSDRLPRTRAAVARVRERVRERLDR